MKRLAVGAPSEPTAQTVDAQSERNLSITPDMRLSVLQHISQTEVTEDELVLLTQILQRANIPVPAESHQASVQNTSSTTDVISESEPILEPRRIAFERPENVPRQGTSTKCFSNPTSESEADFESRPSPGGRKPHRKPTLPPAQTESRESQRGHCNVLFVVHLT